MLGPAGMLSARDAVGGKIPEAPSNLDATQTSTTSAQVTWDDNSVREDSFVIYRAKDGGAFSQVDTVGANVEQYDDTGLTSGSTYEYKVAAKNEAGESTQAGPVSVLLAENVPDAPSVPNITVVSSSQLDLMWADNATNEDEYKVQQEGPGGGWLTVATLPADSTSYSHTGLAEGSYHKYRIQACNTGGCSTSPSNDAYTQLTTPTGFNASDDGNHTTLTWTDNSSNEQNYEVYKDGSLYDTLPANTETYDISCNTGPDPGDAEGTFKVRAIHSEIPASDFSNSDTGVADCSTAEF